jgi:hypothetical protein
MILFLPKKSNNILILAGQGGGKIPPADAHGHICHYCGDRVFVAATIKRNMLYNFNL